MVNYISNRIKKLRGINKKLKNDLKNSTRKLKRCITKKEKLLNILKKSQQNEEFSAETLNGLNNDIDQIPKSLIARFYKNRKLNINSKQEYPIELRKFAITLHYSSPRAYEYVRQIFNKALPSSSTIRNWYSSVDCEPGFISESFEFLKKKCTTVTKVALSVDEMSIMRNIDLRGPKVRGFVDKGNGENSDKEATEAFVFMATCLNEHWKIPIAYFLIDAMSAEERKNLVNQAILRLHESNVEVVSLTCDGPVTNISMLKKLGMAQVLFCLLYIIILRYDFT